MGKIKILDEATASRIAAGEVVTGPSPVIKELLENSIDAGSDSISVEIANGGRDLMRVTDNGAGIANGEVSLAIQKHATSKISSVSDLSSIATLGFRGEALSSIAAVARLTISSRERGSGHGNILKVNGGKDISILPAGLPEGTTVKVENLFFNLPARRKFMGGAGAEAARITNVVSKMILAKPEIAFKYVNNKKTVYQSTGSGKPLDALMTVFGVDIADKVRNVDFGDGQMRVEGYVSKPSILHKSASNIVFFVNGRYVQSKLLTDSLIEAYGERILRSHFPLAVIHIDVPFELVDVNMHPNKLQVMFSDDLKIKDAVSVAVQEALAENHTPVLRVEPKPPMERVEENAGIEQQSGIGGPEEDEAINRALRALPKFNSADMSYRKPQAVRSSASNLMEPFNTDAVGVRFEKIMDEIIEEAQQDHDGVQAEMEDVRKLVNYSIVGQAFNTYIICECGQALYIIDQHAAHERITYEAMKSSIQSENSLSQQLLTPVIKKFSQSDYDILNENLELLSGLGFEIEEFGELTLKFSALPVQIEGNNLDSLADDVIHEIKRNPKDVLIARDKVISAACRHSVKAGDSLSGEQLAQIMDEISRLDAIPNCPHGRPIAIAVTKNDLQKGFFRTL